MNKSAYTLEVTIGAVNGQEESNKLSKMLQKWCCFYRGTGYFYRDKVQFTGRPSGKPQIFQSSYYTIFLKDKVEVELARLQSLGIITPVKHSSWAAPVDPVLKQNGTIRLCGNYRITINTDSEGDTYHLSRVEEFFAAMAGGKVFSKLICVRHICDWLWENLPLINIEKYAIQLFKV